MLRPLLLLYFACSLIGTVVGYPAPTPAARLRTAAGASVCAKKKAGPANRAGKGFGAAPASAASSGKPKLVPVDLGGGKEVSVMLPHQAEDVSEMELAMGGGDLLKQYQHLYGAGDVVWPASVALARMLAHVPSFTAGKRVLELGCGLGASGLAAASAGASSVVLTDRDAELLALATQAAAANGVSGAVSTAILDWAADEAAITSTLGAEPFDVIIGSDILYDEGAVQLLAALLAKLMLPGHTSLQRCLVADPSQRLHRESFAAACGKHGLVVSDDPLPGPEGVRLVGVLRDEA